MKQEHPHLEAANVSFSFTVEELWLPVNEHVLHVPIAGLVAAFHISDTVGEVG